MDAYGPNNFSIVEASDRIINCSSNTTVFDEEAIVSALQNDNIVLIENVSPGIADAVTANICERFDLLSKLKVQAGFATTMGHRHKVEQFYMTVNNRDDYEFIPPHSEGMSFMNIQLATFYCYENSTDGGETMLFNTNQDERLWSCLREEVVKAKILGSLSKSDITKAKLLYKVNLPEDELSSEDKILQESPSAIPNLEIYTVLTKAKATYSVIQGKKMYANWDSIASTDATQAEDFYHLLKSDELLRENPHVDDWSTYDNARDRKCWSSESQMSDLYNCKVVYKLKKGDLLLINNMSWTHAVNNWTPGTGIRKVTAAFA